MNLVSGLRQKSVSVLMPTGPITSSFGSLPGAYSKATKPSPNMFLRTLEQQPDKKLPKAMKQGIVIKGRLLEQDNLRDYFNAHIQDFNERQLRQRIMNSVDNFIDIEESGSGENTRRTEGGRPKQPTQTGPTAQ